MISPEMLSLRVRVSSTSPASGRALRRIPSSHVSLRPSSPLPSPSSSVVTRRRRKRRKRSVRGGSARKGRWTAPAQRRRARLQLGQQSGNGERPG